MSNDGFLDFSLGEGDEGVIPKAKKFKAEGGRAYRATFCWFSVKTEDGWDDSLAFQEDGTLHPEAKIRFTGCERHYLDGVGYFLHDGPAFARFGSPKQTVATIICVWPTDKDGDLDKASFANGKGFQVQPWYFSADKYSTIKKSNKRFSLMDHDLLMSCPPDGGQFQKLTFTPEENNLLRALLASEKPSGKAMAAKIIAEAHKIGQNIQNGMAQKLTIDQVREKLGEDVASPTGTTGHAAADVEKILDDVL
jgi:hypothetical protein